MNFLLVHPGVQASESVQGRGDPPSNPSRGILARFRTKLRHRRSELDESAAEEFLRDASETKRVVGCNNNKRCSVCARDPRDMCRVSDGPAGLTRRDCQRDAQPCRVALSKTEQTSKTESCVSSAHTARSYAQSRRFRVSQIIRVRGQLTSLLEKHRRSTEFSATLQRFGGRKERGSFRFGRKENALWRRRKFRRKPVALLEHLSRKKDGAIASCLCLRQLGDACGNVGVYGCSNDLLDRIFPPLHKIRTLRLQVDTIAPLARELESVLSRTFDGGPYGGGRTDSKPTLRLRAPHVAVIEKHGAQDRPLISSRVLLFVAVWRRPALRELREYRLCCVERCTELEIS